MREGFEIEFLFTASALAAGFLTLLKLVLEIFLIGPASFLAELASADSLLTFFNAMAEWFFMNSLIKT